MPRLLSRILGFPSKPATQPTGPRPPGYGRQGPPDDPNLINSADRRFSVAPPYSAEPRDPALDQLEILYRKLGPGDLPADEAARPSVFRPGEVPVVGNQFGFRPVPPAPAAPAMDAGGAPQDAADGEDERSEPPSYAGPDTDDDAPDADGPPDQGEAAAPSAGAPKRKAKSRKKWRKEFAARSAAAPLASIPEGDESEATSAEADEARAAIEAAQRRVGPLPPVTKLDYPEALGAQEWKDSRSFLEKAAMRRTGVGARLEAVQDAFLACATPDSMFDGVPSESPDPADPESVRKAREDVANRLAAQAEKATALLHRIEDARIHIVGLLGNSKTLESTRTKLPRVVQELARFRARVEDRSAFLVHFNMLVVLRDSVKRHQDAILPLFGETVTMADAKARFNGANKAFQSVKMMPASCFIYASKVAGSRPMPFGRDYLDDTVPPRLASVVSGGFIANLQVRVKDACQPLDDKIASLQGSMDQIGQRGAYRESAPLLNQLEDMLDDAEAAREAAEKAVVKEEMDALRSEVENSLPNAAVKLDKILNWLKALPEADEPAS